VAKEVEAATGASISYQVGTMIELPRAALRAGDIAQTAEFFSFGTNDLTQTTYGLSRDDSGTFLGDYLAQGIFQTDPFVSLDPDGVGELVQIAAERGRKTRPNIKLGICGEHGGDPASIAFCEKVGLDYVSCSPFRVPIARLAAAQAVVRAKGLGGTSSAAYAPRAVDGACDSVGSRAVYESLRAQRNESGLSPGEPDQLRNRAP
jgi:pyruvate, orthophosphate dikinase